MFFFSYVLVIWGLWQNFDIYWDIKPTNPNRVIKNPDLFYHLYTSIWADIKNKVLRKFYPEKNKIPIKKHLFENQLEQIISGGLISLCEI